MVNIDPAVESLEKQFGDRGPSRRNFYGGVAREEVRALHANSSDAGKNFRQVEGVPIVKNCPSRPTDGFTPERPELAKTGVRPAENGLEVRPEERPIAVDDKEQRVTNPDGGNFEIVRGWIGVIDGRYF